MRKIIITFFCLVASITLFAQDGKSCSTAIPLSKDFSVNISESQEVWYSAWTFDLPLTVTFTPQNGSSDPAPEVEMDFSCTSGFYEDSILCSLFCKTADGGGITFDMPHKPALQSDNVGGKFVYYLSLGEKYRDLLLKMGIDYNLEVFVKVIFNSAGKLEMAPNDLFNNCMDGSKFMHFGDTVQVKEKDKDRHVIVPYVQWQEDTVIYKWEGTFPCILAVAKSCDFDPSNNTSDKIIQYTTTPIQPGDSIKTKAPEIYNYVHNPEYKSEAGMYFAKFYSDEPGIMTVTKAKQAPPRGDAIVMRYGRTYALDANSTAIYAIPTSWNKDTKFFTPTAHIFRMIVAKDPNFTAENILAQYQFNRSVSGHWHGLSAEELNVLWGEATEKYLYLLFDCSEATTIMADEWQASDCYKNARLMPFVKDTTFKIDRRSTVKYRFYMPDWKDGNISALFNKDDVCAWFVSEECAFSSTSPYPQNFSWVAYREMEDKDAETILSSDMQNWSTDEDGYIYMRFFTEASGGGYITLHSNAEKETDPVYPHATISAVCEGNNVKVSVSKAQHISIEGTLEEWNALPGTPHEITLSSGTYTLKGEQEEIQITLP